MYSRNYTAERTFSDSAAGKNNPGGKNIQFKENIPVKSFTDSFAYDRFNRMGTQVKIATETALTSENKRELLLNKDDVSDSIDHSEVATFDEVNDIQVKEIHENQVVKEEISIWTRLKNVFDADTLLILLAVSMLLFSDNATNDKLTPLALLAILFF